MTQENFNEEYYKVFSTIDNNSPSFFLTDDLDLDLDLDLEISERLDNIPLLTFELDEPYPKKNKPLTTDYFGDGGSEIVSQKIYNVLNPLNIEGIQLMPSTIYDPKNKKIYDNCYFLHIYNYIECLDRDKSEYDYDEELNTFHSIDKLLLDASVLSKIPLEKRLIFRLSEFYVEQLFHKSIVEKIMAANPEGIRFVKLTDCTTGTAFN
jgi:hypothetical protein